LTSAGNTGKIVDNMKFKYGLSITLFVIVLFSLYLGSCAPPVGHAPVDWSFNINFPYWTLPFGFIGLALYFLPTIIAAIRRSKSTVGIILVNILAGWTFVGWVIALVWSLVGETSRK